MLLNAHSTTHSSEFTKSHVLAAVYRGTNTPSNMSVTSVDHMGNIPLHWAALQGTIDTVKHLIQLGSPLNFQNYAGLTPLHCSLLRQNCPSIDMLSILLRCGANANLPNLVGETALHTAVGVGSRAECELLIRFGAHVNAQEHNGETPLHYAVREGKLEIIQLLLACGADPSLQNDDEESALDLARDLGERYIVNLLSQGARTPQNQRAKNLFAGVSTSLFNKSLNLN